MTEFHETWYERCAAIEDQPNSYFLISYDPP
jgi:hypothetical protein